MSEEEKKLKKSDILHLHKYVRKALDKPRYIHTLGVAYTATSLAMVYGENLEKARIAGLLHDIAKPVSNDDKIKICRDNNIEISHHEMALPHLLHAKVGMHLANEIYGIQDQDILNAIRFHTTGRPGMSLLEKIIYVADYIEPGRFEAPNLKRVRPMAFQDLDKCLYEILEGTLEYLDSKKDSVDPLTRDTYIYYRNLLSDK